MTQTFDPGRHTSGDTIFDGPATDPLDFADTSNLTGSEIAGSTGISVGSSVFGVISTSGEQDIFSITFEAGQTYTIDALGSPSGGGSLNETDLHLYSSNGTFIEYDDLSGDGFDASMSFTATTTGTYYIMVDEYFGTGTGTYTLQIEEAAPPPPPPGGTGTVEQLATFLQEGTQGFSRSYDTSASNQITVNLNGLTADGQKLARWAMETWEMVADVDFVEVSFGETITLDDEDSGAFAYYPNAGSTSAGVELNVSKGWLSSYGTTLNSYSFQTYIHEFGHALGLRHQGNYNGSADYQSDAYFTNDSWQSSIMSYFNQSENTSINASYALVMTAQMADIMAIQDFYGTPGASGATAGNTTFGRGSNLGNYMDDVFAGLQNGQTTAFTLYDQGGIDTIDFGFYNSFTDLNIDLNDGAFSDLGANRIGVMGIAVGTVIENIETGAGDDTITANEFNNQIIAGAGNDLVLSGAGNDTTTGGSGNDTIYGGNGNDNLTATSGANEIYGGAGSDFLGGGTGNDVLGGGAGNDIIQGGSGNDTLWGSSGNDNIAGQQNNDLIGAGANRDTVNGGAGNDTVYGGGGQDQVDGGDDSDIVGGGEGTDVVNGGSGNDTLWGQGGTDTLNGGKGNDDIAGGGQGDLLIGQQGNDTLNGGYGNDTLSGGADNDTLNGNFGNDIMTGGLGADTFVFDDGGAKTVTDFSLAEGDILQLDDALWGGGLTEAQVVDQFADASSGTVVLTLGGTVITLEGVTTTDGLAGALDLF
ncbi:MAG: hypothetical protein AAFY74_18535 [Pseudomonadota bacterium]